MVTQRQDLARHRAPGGNRSNGFAAPSTSDPDAHLGVPLRYTQPCTAGMNHFHGVFSPYIHTLTKNQRAGLLSANHFARTLLQPLANAWVSITSARVHLPVTMTPVGDTPWRIQTRTFEAVILFPRVNWIGQSVLHTNRDCPHCEPRGGL